MPDRQLRALFFVQDVVDIGSGSFDRSTFPRPAFHGLKTTFDELFELFFVKRFVFLELLNENKVIAVFLVVQNASCGL